MVFSAKPRIPSRHIIASHLAVGRLRRKPLVGRMWGEWMVFLNGIARRLGSLVGGLSLILAVCGFTQGTGGVPDNFEAQVETIKYGQKGEVIEEKSLVIRGTVFADGYSFYLDEKQPESGEPLEQCARTGDSLRTLIYSRTRAGGYQAYWERSLAPRFASPAMQAVALSLCSEPDFQALESGQMKVALELGGMVPEYFNRYLVEPIEQTPGSWRIIARAPNFLVTEKGATPMPAPFERGFQLWTLEVREADGRPAHSVFTRYFPDDQAVTAARSGLELPPLQKPILSAVATFSWSADLPAVPRLPRPPALPFSIQDHRAIFDVYTNNRMSLAVEGAAVLRSTNANWSVSEESAQRASMYIQRGLADRDESRKWKPFLWGIMLFITLVFAVAVAVGVTKTAGKNNHRNK